MCMCLVWEWPGIMYHECTNARHRFPSHALGHFITQNTESLCLTPCYVYITVYMYVCMYMYIYIMSTHMHTHPYIHIPASMYANMYTVRERERETCENLYARTQKHITSQRTQIPTHRQTQVHISVCIYTYICTYGDTHNEYHRVKTKSIPICVSSKWPSMRFMCT